MGFSPGKKDFVADINVTPFVDVMLVLLIIFMVTAPLMTEGLDVDLPQTVAANALPTDKDHIVLSLRRDGAVYIDTYPVPDLDAFEAQLAAVAGEQKRQVFIQADKEVPYGLVVAIMGRIQAAGIYRIGIVAERLENIALTPAGPQDGATAAPAAGAGNTPRGR